MTSPCCLQRTGLFLCCATTWHHNYAAHYVTAHELHIISCHRDECVACVSRSADAAVQPVASCGADGVRPRGAPEVMELIPSSQDSPKISPPDLMLLLPQTDEPNGLHEPDEACVSASATPAFSTVTRAS